MPLFRYRAARHSGEVVEGELEGADSLAVMRALQAQGLVPIRAEPVKARWALPRLAARLEPRDMEIFTVELSLLLNAGVQLDRALVIMADLAANPVMKSILAGLSDQIREGKSFADALATYPKHFPPMLVSLTEAGELSGHLAQSLERGAAHMESARETREALASALAYPIILCVLAVASVILMVTVVVPRFASLFEDAGVALPAATQALVVVGDVLVNYGLYIALGCVAGGIAFQRGLRNATMKRQVDQLVLSLPVIGALVSMFEASRFARTMSTLLGSGTRVPDALRIATRGTSNAAISTQLDRVAEGVRAGRGLAEQLDAVDVFPRLTGHLVRVGEETDQLVNVLDRLAHIFESDVERSLRRAITMLEPALVVVVGVIVGAVIFGILSAVLSVNELT
jgi:general secretion pathway protein F